MSDAPRFPAGWYADPENPTVHRWWDGVRWTEARQPAYAAPQQPPAPPQYVVPPQNTAPPQPAPVPQAAPPQPAPVPQAAPPQPAPVPQAAPPQGTAPQPPLPTIAPLLTPSPQAGPPPYQPAAPAHPAVTQAYPSAAPAYPSAPAEIPRRDIPTGTVWIWLVVLLPLASFLMLFLLDWRGYVEDLVSVSSSPGAAEAWAVNWTIGSLGLTALGYVLIGAQIVFAFLDWRALRARGVERPFHWAWIFLALVVSNGVYVIGRGVVLRRRTGSGLTPVWVWIAITVLSWVVGIVLAVVLFNEILAALSREGLLTGTTAP